MLLDRVEKAVAHFSMGKIALQDWRNKKQINHNCDNRFSRKVDRKSATFWGVFSVAVTVHCIDMWQLTSGEVR